MSLIKEYNWLIRIRKRVENMLLGVLFILATTGLEAGDISVKLEGCKAGDNGYVGEMVPDYYGGPDYKMYFCNEADYTTGVLGTWNELDMIPLRFVLDNKSSSDQNFTFYVGGDYEPHGANPGWDYITQLVLDEEATRIIAGPANADAVVAACNAAGARASQQLVYLNGRILREVIVRDYPAGLICVPHYNMRLSLGSGINPGASLSALLAVYEGESQTGTKNLGIKIGPSATLNKTMTAVQDGAIDWTVTKSSSPASVNFSDTCSDVPSALERDLNITVSWVKGEPTPEGNVNVTTLISASNLALRPIDISVVDTLYSGTTALETMAPCTKTLAKNTLNEEVCTHTYTIAEGDAVNLNDKAVATFTDPDTGVEILAEKEATASADVQSSGSNDDETAYIKDHEWIGGDTNLSYSVESTVGASGTFDNYPTLGVKTREDVNWTSVTQSASGSVTFHKKIHVAKGAQTVGHLYDKAFLFGSDGFETDSGSSPLSISLSSSASGVLTIVKEVQQDIIDENKTVVFAFTISSGGLPIQDLNITVPAGHSSASSTITGLPLGSYNVFEHTTPGYEIVGSASQQADLTKCKATITFTNKLSVTPPSVKVKKVTHPDDENADWTMTLYEEISAGEWNIKSSCDTNGTGECLLLAEGALTPGSYKIEETLKEGWYNVGSKGDCIFTYDGGNRDDYQCTFGNAQYSTIIINKVIDSSNTYTDRFSFNQDINSSIVLELGDGESQTFENVKAYPNEPLYKVRENIPTNFRVSAIDCQESRFQFDLDQGSLGIYPEPGETVECTFTNQIVENPSMTIEKRSNGQDADVVPGPSILVGDPVEWTYTITNNGDVTLSNISVIDDQGVSVSCPATTLAVGESMICTASATATAGQYSNLGTVTANTPEGAPISDNDRSHYFGEEPIVEYPSIVIEKSTNGQDADVAPGPSIIVGSAVNWNYIVRNNGDVALSDISVTDDQGVSVSCPATTLAVGESMTCTANGTATAGQYSNLGTVTSMTPAGAPVSDDDPSHYYGEEPVVENPSIVIEKSTNGEDADVVPGPNILAGDPVEWMYVVTNTGDVALNTVNVIDSRGVSVSCPATTLAVGASMTCTASGTATAGQYSNLGTVTAMTPERASVSDDDPSHYYGEEPIVENPSIVIEKSTNGEDADEAPGPDIFVDDTVEWTYTITNNGDVTLSNISVTDDQGVSVSCPATTLAVGASMTCTASGTATVGQYANIGMVTAMTPEGASVSDDDPSHYFGEISDEGNETDCFCDDIESDSSPALNDSSIVIMMLMTLMLGLFFVRKEELNRNKR